MEALFILATVMALFGVVGYLRGIKSTLFTAAVIWLGWVGVTLADKPVARIVNLLNKMVQLVLSGGLGALGGGGSAGMETLSKKLNEIKPLINDDGTGPGLPLIFLVLILTGFLLGLLKLFKSRHSLLGLALGLINGFTLSTFMLRSVLPKAGVNLPQLTWLFGGTQQATSSAPVAPTGQSLIELLMNKILVALTSLADKGQLAILIVIAIAIFIVLATRLGSRSVKKG